MASVLSDSWDYLLFPHVSIPLDSTVEQYGQLVDALMDIICQAD